jgi:Short C-terminal domain
MDDAPAETAAQPPAAQVESTRGRTWLVRGLVALGTLVLVVAVLAVFVAREVLDTNTYSNTSTQIMEQPAVQQALATYLVNQLYANVNVGAEIKPLLPKQAQALAGPVAAGLREFAQRAALELVSSDQFLQVWVKANRLAHSQLLIVLNGGGPRLGTSGGVVTLQTGSMIQELASRIGIQPTALANGRIVIMTSNQLSAAQTIAKALKTAAYVLPFVAIFLYGLAIYLSRRRRETVRACGIGVIIAGVILLLARVLIGNYIVDSLVQIPQNRPAASAVWSVLTADLKDATRTVIAVGLIAVVWAWVSGRGARALSVRRALAPYARDHAGRVWLVFSLVILLLIWWAPTNAARRALPVVVLTALAALGLEAIRRQSMGDFPTAQAGVVAAGVRSRMPTRDRSHAAGNPGPDTEADPEVDRLERLAALHAQGALSDEEFAALKRSPAS